MKINLWDQMSKFFNYIYLAFGLVLLGEVSQIKPKNTLFLSLRFKKYMAALILILLNLSCSKSNTDPDLPNYFVATVDGREIDFDNYVEAQINVPKQVSTSKSYVFLIEASKVSGGSANLMYLNIQSQSPIKAITYDNSIRPDDVWFLGAGGTPPNDTSIPTGSKVTILSLSDTHAEGTFYGEVYAKGDTNNKKIIIKDGKFRVRYKVNK